MPPLGAKDALSSTPWGARIAVQHSAVVSVDGRDRPVAIAAMDLAQQSSPTTRTAR